MECNVQKKIQEIRHQLDDMSSELKKRECDSIHNNCSEILGIIEKAEKRINASMDFLRNEFQLRYKVDKKAYLENVTLKGIKQILNGEIGFDTDHFSIDNITLNRVKRLVEIFKDVYFYMYKRKWKLNDLQSKRIFKEIDSYEKDVIGYYHDIRRRDYKYLLEAIESGRLDYSSFLHIIEFLYKVSAIREEEMLLVLS